MSDGWSDSDKAVAKAAADRARKRAEEEAIALHAAYPIRVIDDLWRLEHVVRDWRKDRAGCGSFSYATANETFAKWLARGWLHLADLSRMSADRVADIKARSDRVPRPPSVGSRQTGGV